MNWDSTHEVNQPFNKRQAFVSSRQETDRLLSAFHRRFFGCSQEPSPATVTAQSSPAQGRVLLRIFITHLQTLRPQDRRAQNPTWNPQGHHRHFLATQPSFLYPRRGQAGSQSDPGSVWDRLRSQPHPGTPVKGTTQVWQPRRRK